MWKLAVCDSSYVRTQNAGDVGVLCVDSPKAKDRVQFLSAREALAAGSVPALVSELSCRGLAVGLGGCATQSDVRVAGRGSSIIVGLPWGVSGAVQWC